MTTADLAPALRDQSDILESVVIKGDLGRLTPEERVSYYREVCRSLGVNPLTQPFQYITLNGRLTLYATRTATDQLRKKHGVSVFKLERELVGDIYTVTAYAQDRDGRHDSSIGAVFVGGLKGDALANQFMRAETKSKRRVTLSLCGLGWSDESEVEGIPEAERTTVDMETGEVLPAPSADRARQGRLLETYGGLLSECRNAGLITEDQMPQWVMPQQFNEETLVERGKKLRAMLQTQSKELPSAPLPHQPAAPSSAGERGTPPSPRAPLWAENRELVRRANELGVAGVPATLNTQSTADVIAAANSVLRDRIREKEREILAAVDFDTEAPM